MIYVIVKRGVYRHEIVGAATQETRAIEIAMEAARAEHDDYHSFEILSGADGVRYEDMQELGTVERKDHFRYVEVLAPYKHTEREATAPPTITYKPV